MTPTQFSTRVENWVRPIEGQDLIQQTLANTDIPGKLDHDAFPVAGTVPVRQDVIVKKLPDPPVGSQGLLLNGPFCPVHAFLKQMQDLIPQVGVAVEIDRVLHIGSLMK